ncbi:MAG: hypothetical protein JXA57_14225, partial [Armatimonadetes bacterium]|nr:hypothetical protein [Armatimonadota bacterium]
MSRESRIALLVGVGASLALAVLLLCAIYFPPTISATVTVSADERDSVTVYDGVVPLSGGDNGNALMRTEIPLDQWEGELIRVDIRTAASRRIPMLGRSRDIACSAELSDANGSRGLNLAGWLRDESRSWHVSA